MKNIFKKSNIENQKGFVALFTVLIASVVLAMAVGIANISLKQIVLSGSATDANKSFYAADSGVECGLFYDLKLNHFADTPVSDVDCGGALQVIDSTSGIYAFEIEFDDGLIMSCAKVSIDKTDPEGSVRLVSRGTNNSCASNNSRTVERVIEVTY